MFRKFRGGQRDRTRPTAAPRLPPRAPHQSERPPQLAYLGTLDRIVLRHLHRYQANLLQLPYRNSASVWSCSFDAPGALNAAEHIRITLDHGFGDGLHVLVIATDGGDLVLWSASSSSKLAAIARRSARARLRVSLHQCMFSLSVTRHRKLSAGRYRTEAHVFEKRRSPQRIPKHQLLC